MDLEKEKGNHSLVVNITSGTIVRAILFTALFYVLYLLRDLLLVIITAVVVASSIEPAAKWLGKYRISRVPAVIIIYACIALVFVGTFFFLLQPLFNETSSFLSNIPQYVDSLDSWSPLKSSDFFGSQIQAISRTLSIKEVVNGLSGTFSNTSEGLIKTLSTVFGGLLSLILIVVISFYLSVQEDGVGKFLRIVTPLKYRKYLNHLWARSQTKIGLWMQGQLLLMVLVAVLVYLGLMVLGIKNALILAALAGVFELIPLFGPILSAIPGIAAAFSGGGVSSGLIVAGMYLIIQQFENHLIFPLVVKKVVGVPALVVIIGLVVGFQLAGFLGAIISAPLATILMEFLNDIQRDRIDEENAANKTA